MPSEAETTTDQATPRATLERRLDGAIEQLDNEWESTVDYERESRVRVIEALSSTISRLPAPVAVPPFDGEALALEVWTAINESGAPIQAADVAAAKIRELTVA